MYPSISFVCPQGLVLTQAPQTSHSVPSNSSVFLRFEMVNIPEGRTSFPGNGPIGAPAAASVGATRHTPGSMEDRVYHPLPTWTPPYQDFFCPIWNHSHFLMRKFQQSVPCYTDLRGGANGSRRFDCQREGGGGGNVAVKIKVEVSNAGKRNQCVNFESLLE